MSVRHRLSSPLAAPYTGARIGSGIDLRRFSLATVVFDAEVGLLELQVRSLAAQLDGRDLDEVLILDNTVFGLDRRIRSRVETILSPLTASTRFVRVPAMLTLRGVDGWRSQQVAKLLVARQISSPYYVVLDAKNHLIASASSETFIAADGRVHGGSHSYERHALGRDLERTLRFIGADDAQMTARMARFPVTATPFVFHTDLVSAMIADLERQHALPFEVIFERERLLEFFTYSSWVDLRGPGLDQIIDGIPIQSPTVWPTQASRAGLGVAIEQAERSGASFFAVHRRALVRGDAEFRSAVARWWADNKLFSSEDEASHFITRFRRRFLPAMVLSRTHERYARVRSGAPKV